MKKLFFLSLFTLLTGQIYAQDISGDESANGIEESRYTTIVVKEGMKWKEALQEKVISNTDPLIYLVQEKGNPIGPGDRITLFEKRTDDDDAIAYPAFLQINYADEKQTDLNLFGLVTETDNPIRFIVSYFIPTGEHYATLWVNRNRNGNDGSSFLYDIEVHPFPMPMGDPIFQEHRHTITSPFGNRVKPDALGHEEFHYGTDFRMPVGTKLIAPFKGEVQLGHVKRDQDEFSYDEFHLGRFITLWGKFTYREDRRVHHAKLQFLYGHTSRFNDELTKAALDAHIAYWTEKSNLTETTQESMRNFWEFILTTPIDSSEVSESQQQERPVLDRLRKNDYSLVRLKKFPIEQGQHLADSGNSGRSTGPHLHLGIIIDDEYQDPAQFYQNFGLRSGVFPSQLLPLQDEVNTAILETLENSGGINTDNQADAA